MNRTKIGKHILARTPYNQIVAAVSIALFITVFVLAGWIGLLVVFVLWLAALLYAGYAFTRREFAEAARMRDEDRRAHEDLIARRRRLGQHMDMTYEERSPSLAARFGRVDQNVVENGDPRHTARARHAAELVAEGVLRMPSGGFPVTVFDLEVVNEFDLGNLARMGRADQAVESAKCYLTVCAVTLPYPLPYLSSLAAWNTGLVEEIAPVVDVGAPGELRHTDDPRFAALLLSVPEVLRAAHNLNLLWTVSGDQLVTATMTSTGITPESALRRATDLAALAGAFPWGRLEPYRRDTAGMPVPWQLHRSPFLVHQWWMESDLLGPGVLRWAHGPLGATGMYAFESVGTDLGEPRQHPGDGLPRSRRG
ncbi:hypothetical protein OHB12_33110 [Nocardia sp. NBC_01730]|uniref:hypothetical protein n=1 Tax=Nocardia sp. NBC_01730 TaxID=2975998 RepID=UPI002E0EDA43|nr:hypothetical protein OHB12_33110 [Nocardia sp. NBC_01730]